MAIAACGHPDTPGEPEMRGPSGHSRWMLQVRSGRGGHVLGQRLGGCPPRECLSWSTVERRRDCRELLGAVPS